VKCKAADFLFLAAVTTLTSWLYDTDPTNYHAHHPLCYQSLVVSLVVLMRHLDRCYICTTISGYALAVEVHGMQESVTLT
jgi:hypothetical protein